MRTQQDLQPDLLRSCNLRPTATVLAQVRVLLLKPDIEQLDFHVCTAGLLVASTLIHVTPTHTSLAPRE